MSEYKPTEYVVDFGDYRSSRFVELNMALIEHNGAKLHEKIVRCEDCKHFTFGSDNGSGSDWCDFHEHIAWSRLCFCSWGERRGDV